MYRFIIPGRPVPKARMTRGGQWVSERAQRTLSYQKEIAWRVKCSHVEGFAPDDDLVLTVRVYVADRKHGDLTNYIKAAEDGLQYSGLVPNDKQIKRYGAGTGIYFSADQRMEIEIGRVGNDNRAEREDNPRYIAGAGGKGGGRVG